VVKSSSDVFREAAMNAVKQWKYEPYAQDGRPQELVFSTFIRFALN